MGMEDYRFALEFKETLARLVKEEIERQRPRYQMATVISFDRVLRKCTVNFPGDTSNAVVNMGSIQPNAIGQVVRVAGVAGDRYIDDVLGAAYDPSEVIDTGWVTAPITGSYLENYGADSPRVRRIGDQVYFVGEATPLTGHTVGGTTLVSTNILLTLGTDFRPVGRDAVFVNQGSSLNRWSMRVQTTGEVYCHRYGDGAASPGSWLPFTNSWAI
jgi:hypothetical protein